MAGYSGTPLWKKLGYKTGISAYVDGAPKNYRSLLALPADVQVKWLARPKSDIEFVHLFATSVSELKAKLKSYRTKIVSNGTIWVFVAKEVLWCKDRHYGGRDSRCRAADRTRRHKSMRSR